jgi:Family of unknown function (DUF5994)
MRVREPRLVIAQRPTRRDRLHGAWWPYSSDIDQELAPMLALVVARFGAVFGVMLNRDEWPDAAVAGHQTRIGKTKVSWYGLAEAHQMVLLCDQSRRLALLVLPSDTPEQIALSATLMACAPGNVLTTDETLTRARAEASSSRSDGAPHVYFSGTSRRISSLGGLQRRP